MNNTYNAHIELHINAPAQKVWEALTTPAIIKEYFFGTHAESDWKVGSSLLFKGEWEGKAYVDKGTILQSNPPYLFQYDYFSSWSDKPDVPENYNTITYELTEKDGGTLLSITQTNCTDEAQQKHSEENWMGIMTGMKALVEK
jgi:uncharacterized protein YndB with AHSA1/START domain